MRTSTVVTPARARCAGFLVFACSLACVPSAFGQSKLVSSWVGPANGECRNPRVSADGRRVVFVSKAANLEELPTTGLDHVYLWDARDRPFPRVLLVSQDTGGLRANGPSENPSISPDGSYVAFNSTAEPRQPQRRGLEQRVRARDLRPGRQRASAGDQDDDVGQPDVQRPDPGVVSGVLTSTNGIPIIVERAPVIVERACGGPATSAAGSKRTTRRDPR